MGAILLVTSYIDASTCEAGQGVTAGLVRTRSDSALNNHFDSHLCQSAQGWADPIFPSTPS
ncbi:hypothetical protein [Nocardia sp. NPDC049149]|uniref:hypothetical protein n=1 Tax=Nocardia sp. NPDC049149 TaxID=3364315 RepID=UPI0037192198